MEPEAAGTISGLEESIVRHEWMKTVNMKKFELFCWINWSPFLREEFSDTIPHY